MAKVELPTSRRHHFKFFGVVDAVEGDKWWARLEIEGRDYYAEMSKPLPPNKGPGHLFTIHTTKRGRQYFYWIERPPMTQRRLKKARQRAREWERLFKDAA